MGNFYNLSEPCEWWDREQRKRSNSELRKKRLALARSKATHTEEQWLALLSEFEGRCVKCGSLDKICKDHIIPLYFEGESSDGIDNIQPLCHWCNSGKTGAIDYARLRRLYGWNVPVRYYREQAVPARKELHAAA